MADGTVDHFLIGALDGAGSRSLVFTDGLAGGMGKLLDGLSLAGQLLMADSTVSHFLVGALDGAGGRVFILTDGLAGGMGKRGNLPGFGRIAAGTASGFHACVLAGGRGGNGPFPEVVAQGWNCHSLGLDCEQRIREDRGVGAATLCRTGCRCGLDIGGLRRLGLDMVAVAGANHRGSHSAVVVAPDIRRCAPGMDVVFCPLGVECQVFGQRELCTLCIRGAGAVSLGVPTFKNVTISSKGVLCSGKRASSDLSLGGDLSGAAVCIIAQHRRRRRGPEIDAAVIDIAVIFCFCKGIIVGLPVIRRCVLIGNAFNGNIRDSNTGSVLRIRLRPLFDCAV